EQNNGTHAESHVKALQIHRTRNGPHRGTKSESADAQFSTWHSASVLRIHNTASSTQRVGIGFRPGRSHPEHDPDAFPLLVREPNHSIFIAGRRQSTILR